MHGYGEQDLADDRICRWGCPHGSCQQHADCDFPLKSDPVWRCQPNAPVSYRCRADPMCSILGIRYLGDVYELSVEDASPPFQRTVNLRWTRVQTTGNLPNPREGHSAVWWPKSNALVVFGGIEQPLARLNNTYLLDLGVFHPFYFFFFWQQISHGSGSTRQKDVVAGASKGRVAIRALLPHCLCLPGGKDDCIWRLDHGRRGA